MDKYQDYKEDVIGNILCILKNFLYHAESFRCINENINKLSGDKEFWIYTNDAHIMIAVTCWCKVFGNSKDKTYWRRMFRNNNSDDEKEMFFDILNEHGISESNYTDLRKQMKRFRDKYVAHSDDYKSPVPYLEPAYEIVFLPRYLAQNMYPL